jgi:thiosulfate/3-mercaptopyruvate sulfurtransferase
MSIDISRRLAMAGAAVAMMGLAAPGAQAKPAAYGNPELLMTTAELQALLGQPDLVILDVRPKAAYDEGHIPDALHLGADDVIDPNSHVEGELLPLETLAEMLGQRGIGPKTRVVLYDDQGGFPAARLFWLLEYLGHRHASILNGGITKWQQDSRELSAAVPIVGRPATFPLTLTERRHATADWIMDRSDDPEVVVIDVRPKKMYVAGHIPWARSIPWADNLAADKTMKPAADLIKHFTAHGVTQDKNIVVHCQQGKAAAHSYFTLRLLGYARVRSYDRSWAEWGAADDLPKATGD